MEDLQFSTPHFISMLIDGGYLMEDNELKRIAITFHSSKGLEFEQVVLFK